MNRAEFQDLADLRIAEAECLFHNGLFEGAYYLAGYSVECGLKACIAKLTKQYDFPDRNTKDTHYVHDFVKLVKTAGLSAILEADCTAKPDLDANWVIVRKWREDSRYEPKGRKTEDHSRDLIQAITQPRDGVLSWIRLYW